jgi:hypothetical protein
MVHFFDQFGADAIVIVEDATLSKQGRKSEGIGKVLFHGLVPMVPNICEPVADAENLVMVGLSLDEGNHIDIAVGCDGPPRA